MMTIVPRNALRQATGIARHDHNPARSTYREEKTVQTMGSTAQKKALIADRKGSTLESLVHQSNVVDASRSDWFKFSRFLEDDENSLPPWFPVIFYVSEKWFEADERNLIGREASARGLLAWLLEKSGYEDLAREQWVLAMKLTGLSEDAMRKRVQIERDGFEAEIVDDAR